MATRNQGYSGGPTSKDRGFAAEHHLGRVAVTIASGTAIEMGAACGVKDYVCA
jgi:hypothetical protein